jgi:glutaredoxin-like protein NrdH
MTLPETIVYTKNNCQPCRATKRMLTERGVPFREVNVDEVPSVREDLIAEGFLASPVVFPSHGEKWAGFDPDRIQALADRRAV